MKKQCMVWGMLVVLVISSLAFMGVKCKQNPEDEAIEDPVYTDKTVTKVDLERAGVPVYPHTEDSFKQSVKIDEYGKYKGGVVLQSTTCPPENVQKYYDQALGGAAALEKEISPECTTYRFIGNNGDSVRITIAPAGSNPADGTFIAIDFL